MTRRPSVLVAASVAAAALFAASPVFPVGGSGPSSPVDRGEAPTVQLVFDTSGSMAEADSAGTVKIEGARSAILNFIAGVDAGTSMGLWTYPSSSGGCGEGQQDIAIAQANGAEMSAIVRTLTPDGGTPTGEALRAAKQQLERVGALRGMIVLVSDGHHTCTEDPCEIARQLNESGTEVQVITVGFRVDEEGAQELRCIADAAHGRYVGVDDSKELVDELIGLTRPRLEITLRDLPARVVADVGNGPDGLVTIRAEIANRSDVEARDVEVMLRFVNTPEAPAGMRPGISDPLVQQLGNISASRPPPVARWRFRPGLLMVGQTVRFQVLARAANTTDDVVVPGEVEVVDGVDLLLAGPVLRRAKRVTVMGDSYSSGEGAGHYVRGTDTPRNTCHRSTDTYLLPLYGRRAELDLACSGAVVANVEGPTPENGEPSQVSKLARLQQTGGPVDAVALTIGGDDVHFRDIVISCLFLPSCDSTIGIPPQASQTYLDQAFAGLDARLQRAYTSINSELNGYGSVRARGRVAPIIVLGYPRILPGADRGSCVSLVTIGQGELDFGSRLVTRLNATIKGSVTAVRERGIPAYYVPTTEDAFLPDHTICDAAPYARAPTSIGLADPSLGEDFEIVRGFLFGGVTGRAKAAYVLFLAQSRRLQELFHPNVEGYRALTRALIRWSMTADGLDAARPRSGVARFGSPREREPSGSRAQAIAHGATLRRGSVYSARGEDFLPGSVVTVEMRSEVVALASAYASPEGRVHVSFWIPRETPSGKHTITLLGRDRAGDPRVAAIPVEVAGPRRIPWLLVVLVSGGSLFAGLALLRFGGRRPRRALSRSPR